MADSQNNDPRTTITKDELILLNAINYGQNEPGVDFAKYETLIPSLIRRGLVTQHTVWRLTEAGQRLARKDAISGE